MRIILRLILAGAVGLTVAGGVAGANAEGAPERVAALEFLQTEVLLALGVTPAGVADPAGYRRWVGIRGEALAGAVDLGTRQSPSLERLKALAPDLIVSSRWRHGAIAERLRAIAPTRLYEDLPSPAEADQFTRMRTIVHDLGGRLGRKQAADRVLATLDRRIAGAREAVAPAAGPVVLAQHVPGTERFRLFTDNSLVVQVTDRLGLANAYDGAPHPHGFRLVGLAGLHDLPAETDLLLVADSADDGFTRATASPVWQALPFVGGGRLHRLPTDTWFFGGPLSAARLAERIAATLNGG